MTGGLSCAARWIGVAILVVAIAGCSNWRGLNSLPLPGTVGDGPGSFTVYVELPDVTSMEPNSRVRVGDVTVGNVTGIERRGWHALLTCVLSGDIELPANATAKLGQTSLLGSLHVELAAPVDGAAVGRLADGDLIPLSAGDAYPTVEQTLGAVSLLLNGGGIGRLQQITGSLATAFAGRDDEFRSLVGELDAFTRMIEGQTDDIVSATENLNSLVGQLADREPVLDRALSVLPAAITTLKDQRDQLVNALDRIGNFGSVTATALDESRESLVGILRDAATVLDSLAAAGPALTRSLSFLGTFPWPNETLEKWVRGDYANLTAIIDLTLSRIDAGIFTGTRWEGKLTELELQWGRTIGQFPSPYTHGNPLIAPYRWDQGP